MSFDLPKVSIAIPTYHRGEVLLRCLERLGVDCGAIEILLVDQTPEHPETIARRLAAWDDAGRVRWLRRDKPSIPAAMNAALAAAEGEVVLFLDDDILPATGLAAAHAANYGDPEVVGVVGQVIQPWQEPSDLPRPPPRTGIWADLDFPFHSLRPAIVRNVMAGNLSVRRAAALEVGGFDENFLGAAYRFETEFCRRLIRAGGKIVFDPKASIRHLKLETGGTRIFGDGVTTSRIEHAVGGYYFALLEGSGFERICYILERLYRTTATRHFMRKPWRIPTHLICHLRGWQLARTLYRQKRAHGPNGRAP